MNCGQVNNKREMNYYNQEVKQAWEANNSKSKLFAVSMWL